MMVTLVTGCEHLSISSSGNSVSEIIPAEDESPEAIGSLQMANKFRAHIDPASKSGKLEIAQNRGVGMKHLSTAAVTGDMPEKAVSPPTGASLLPRKSIAGSSVSRSDALTATVLSPAKNQFTHFVMTQENASEEPMSEIAPETRLSKDSKPEEVCRLFITALSTGDHIAASQILTNIAQIETARADLQLESPGSSDASWEVLEADYATSAKQIAQVRCLLQEPGQSETAQLTWLMRRQYNGWKISGMSIQVDGSGEVDLLSFENPLDLQRIQSSVEN